jgi:predicted enzyme related to lactoylglutathione lyase
MFSKGNATIFVSDMDRSVKFYTEVLGLKLAQRFGNHWASVETGGLSIGLHPASGRSPSGKDGSTIVGFEISGIEKAVSKLQEQGVKFRGPIVQDEAGKFAYFEDPDGMGLYMFQVEPWAQHKSGGESAYQHQQ